jgi:uncharacterized protein (TIGR02996 family)
MTHEEAFLQDILSSPQDDAPRLVYADWLEERNQGGDAERAEFIRGQIVLARLPANDPQRSALEARVRVLLEAYSPTWTPPFQDWVEHYEFRRGFVAWVRISGRNLLEHGGQLLRLVPVEEITLEARSEEVPALADCRYLNRVTKIEVRGMDLGDEGVATLLMSPYLGGLGALILHHCGLTQAGAETIVAAQLDQLKVLNLGANNLHDEGLTFLATAPELAGLTYLGLGANELYPAGARALAESPHLMHLNEINLGANYLDDEALALLGAAPNLSSLTSLDLRFNEFGTAGAIALAESPYLGNLTYLDVSGNRLDGEATHRLLRRFGRHVHLGDRE